MHIQKIIIAKKILSILFEIVTKVSQNVEPKELFGFSVVVADLTTSANTLGYALHIKRILKKTLFITQSYHIEAISQKKPYLFTLQEAKILQKKMNILE